MRSVIAIFLSHIPDIISNFTVQVTRVNSDILRKRVVASPSFELPYETTEATIRKRYGRLLIYFKKYSCRLGGDDEDVCMDTLKISLLCPVRDLLIFDPCFSSFL